MKINTSEIYNPDHLSDNLKKEIAKLAVAKQAGIDDVCRDDPIERGLVNAHILNTIGQNVSEPGELSLEETKRTLTRLEQRFNENMHLHEGINWSDVKASLEASPDTLWSIVQMEAKGHKPDVYHDDKQYYYFGTCSKESPKNASNCTYDEAVKMAEAMGIKLMPPEHYKGILQEKGRFDKGTWSWLLTHSNIRSTGDALSGFRLGDGVDGAQSVAAVRYIYRAWRGSLRVKKVTA